MFGLKEWNIFSYICVQKHCLLHIQYAYFWNYHTLWSRFVVQEGEIDLAGRGSGLHGRGLSCAELYSKLPGRRLERVIVPTIGILPDCFHSMAHYCPLGLLQFRLKHSNTLKRKHLISHSFTSTGLPLRLNWIMLRPKSDVFFFYSVGYEV